MTELLYLISVFNDIITWFSPFSEVEYYLISLVKIEQYELR